MSLRPTALVIDKESPTGMYVVIDDPDASNPLLIPCSWDHRRIDVSSDELYGGRYEVHAAREIPTPDPGLRVLERHARRTDRFYRFAGRASADDRADREP